MVRRNAPRKAGRPPFPLPPYLMWIRENARWLLIDDWPPEMGGGVLPGFVSAHRDRGEGEAMLRLFQGLAKDSVRAGYMRLVPVRAMREQIDGLEEPEEIEGTET